MEVSQVDLSTLADRPNALPALKRASGRLAIQAHTGTVRFRNMQIQRLDDEARVSTNPLSNRFPATVLTGEWKVDGEELVETQAVRERGAMIYFGDPSLSDYNFHFKARSTSDSHGFKAVFHGSDIENNFCVFSWGNYFNKGCRPGLLYQGNWGRDNRHYRAGAVDLTRWYNVRIEVRGPQFRCYVDDELIFEHTDARFTHGQVGLSTWDTGARFKDIVVTSADGKQVLLAGLPRI